MKHYTRNLSFENQYLLWTTYIKPYFQYLLPIISFLNKTTIEKFHQKMRVSLKNFLGLPKNIPAEAFKLMIHTAMAKTISKIKKIFAGSYQLEDKSIPEPVPPTYLEKISKNFK